MSQRWKMVSRMLPFSELLFAGLRGSLLCVEKKADSDVPHRMLRWLAGSPLS